MKETKNVEEVEIKMNIGVCHLLITPDEKNHTECEFELFAIKSKGDEQPGYYYKGSIESFMATVIDIITKMQKSDKYTSTHLKALIEILNNIL